MPRLVEGSAAVRRPAPELARRWGIDGPVVVAGGAGDNAAAACGVGVVTAGRGLRLARHLGRALRLQRRASRPTPPAPCTPSATPSRDTWHQMGVILSAADSLDWLAPHHRPQAPPTSPTPSARSRRRRDDHLPALPLRRAHAAQRRRRPRRLRRPLASRTTPRDLAQAVMEGVAFAFADCQRVLRRRRHRLRPRARRRRRRALRHLARRSSPPCSTARSRSPPTAMSARALGAARLGHLRRRGRRPGRGLRRAATIMRVIEPDPALRAAATASGYARYRALYPAIEGGPTMSDFFKGIEPVPFKGPDSDDPLAFRFYKPDRWCSASAWRTSCARRRLLAHLRLAGRRPVRRPDLRAALVRRRHGGAPS